MGVYIFLDIIPNHIKVDEWKEVYEETVKLIDAYPFMDHMIDDTSYDHPWKYVDRAKERELSLPYGEALGWHLFGDLESMQAAESVKLVRDITYYLHFRKEDPYGDVLAKQVFYHVDSEEEYEGRSFANQQIFDGKTQGFPHHIYLLAIACLIESRFPQYAIVYGDISIGQMKKAIEWANTILDRPIQLSERVDNSRLLKRIRGLIDSEANVLKAFMNLTFHDKDSHLGEFVRKNFSENDIHTYYQKSFSDYSPAQFGFRDRLRDYINMGYSIKDACEICVLDSSGCKYDEDEFIETVLSLEWPTTKRTGEDPLSLKTSNREEPDTVYQQFGEILMQMSGVQESLKIDLTYQEVVQVLEEVFNKSIPMQDFTLDTNEDKEEIDSLMKLLDIKNDKWTESENMSAFDIEDPEELIRWKPGDTIHPGLESALYRLKDFIKKSIEIDREALFTDFASYNDWDKMNYLIRHHRFFHIRKSAWEEIKDNLDNPQLAKVNLAILLIEANEVGVNQLCKALVNNQDLLREYILW